MKRQIKKGIFYALLGFSILFLLRLVYGFVIYPNGELLNNTNYVQSFEFSKRNYASKKMKRSENGGNITNLSIDQKYEKIATLSASSSKFETDERKTRKTIQNNNALIQFEKKSGLKGNRYLHLAIGVDPDKFEKIIEELKVIGKITGIDVNKTDKTSEYQDLQAKKTSLEKTLNNLRELKGRSGKIEELINLEERILDIESQIQNLGISLGAFNAENEFCTVKFSLRESTSGIRSIPFVTRLKTAFEWTVKYYLLFLGIVSFAALGSLLIVSTVKIAIPIVHKYWQE